MSGWEIFYHTLKDGALLRWGRWSAAAPVRGQVMILAGRVEFLEKYTTIAQELAVRGYESVCFDWRGQGGSSRLLAESEKGHIENFDTYLADLAEAWTLAPHPRRFILAHSTGAHLALRFIGETEKNIDGIIVTAPLVRPHTFGVPYAFSRAVTLVMGLLFPTAYAMGQKPFRQEPNSFAGNRLTSDEKHYHAWQTLRAKHPDLNTAGATWGWVKAAMESEEKLLAALPKVQCPVLALLTPNDPLVDGVAQEALPRLLPHCHAVRLPDSRHEVLEERPAIQKQAWGEIERFITEPLKNNLDS